jgi:uncharacterized protein with GYD domain
VHGRFEDAVKSIRQLKAVKRVFPTLGRYDAVVDLEVADLRELGRTVLRMGNIAETLVEIQH